MRAILGALSLVLLAPGVVAAQLWAGILAPARATDWSTAGAVIPTRTIPCATIAPYTGTAATINNAIAACPSGQVVVLQAGTFTLSTGIDFRTSNVTLRGAGAAQTKLIINGAVGGGGIGFLNSAIRFMSGAVGIGCGLACGGTPPDQATTWTAASYGQGTTVLTLGTTTGLVAGPIGTGTVIWLDQLDDTTTGVAGGYPTANDVRMCADSGAGPDPCANQGDNHFGRTDRSQLQGVTVTAINGNQVTISPGLRAPNWRASQAPGAWWNTAQLKNAGIEDLTIDFTNAASSPGILVKDAVNCWLKGLRWIKNNGVGAEIYHVWLIQAVHVTTSNSYFYGPTIQANTQYTYTPHTTSDLLFENNILHHNVSAILPNDPEQGSVYAYNYVDDEFYSGAPQLHGPGEMMNLHEGNNYPSVFGDIKHGTHHFETFFRNHLDGFAHNGSQASQNAGFALVAHNRFFNLIGNVIGHSHFTTYVTLLADDRDSIYEFGSAGNNSGVQVNPDPDVLRTVLRWGNWDNATSAVRFVASENPSGIANFPNVASPLVTFPASFYLSAKPSWWGPNPSWGVAEPPFPPIGPDVTGGPTLPNGALTGGHAYKIPARLCFENTAVDPAYATSSPRILNFNAASCYFAPTESVPPVAPRQPFAAGMIVLLAYALWRVRHVVS